MGTRAWTTILLLFTACTFSDTLEADLPSGRGLEEGSPVEALGVRVGSVQEVKLTGGQVRVRAEVDSLEDLDLRADACALAGGDPAKLVIATGGSATPLPEGNALPPCSLTDLAGGLGTAAGELLQGLGEALTGENMREAGEVMGMAARQLGEGFSEGATGGDLRGTGRSLGMAARELGEGLAEGAGVDPATGQSTP